MISVSERRLDLLSIFAALGEGLEPEVEEILLPYERTSFVILVVGVVQFCASYWSQIADHLRL